jgi:hypothetical protein
MPLRAAFTIYRLFFRPMTQNCAICLEPIGVDMGMIDCGHCFCSACIQKWCAKDSTCPICRADVNKIRLFYRSFFMGDEIQIAKRKQKMSDDSSTADGDDFVSNEIVYDQTPDSFLIDEFHGTVWKSGHRISLRERHQHRSEGFKQFRLQLLRHKQSRSEELGTVPLWSENKVSQMSVELIGRHDKHSLFGSTHRTDMNA